MRLVHRNKERRSSKAKTATTYGTGTLYLRTPYTVSFRKELDPPFFQHSSHRYKDVQGSGFRRNTEFFEQNTEFRMYFTVLPVLGNLARNTEDMEVRQKTYGIQCRWNSVAPFLKIKSLQSSSVGPFPRQTYCTQYKCPHRKRYGVRTSSKSTEDFVNKRPY
jgi:hypothetical protein